jgi:hypothetical protein
MPPSQLKRLKASLREQGITGPQKSKKQRKKGLSTEQKIKRNDALSTIRGGLNPFEVKFLTRPPKNPIIDPRAPNGRITAIGRPGASKSLAEERVSLPTFHTSLTVRRDAAPCLSSSRTAIKPAVSSIGALGRAIRT